MSVLILGAGPRVGLGIAKKFQSEGYKVALGSRCPNAMMLESQGFLPIIVDTSKTENIEAAFAEVRRRFGVAPNVVVYNAVSVESFPDPKDAFSVPIPSFVKDANVNIIGAYSAMKEAVAGFKTITDPAVPKLFISTGNIMPFKPAAIGTGFVTGKAAQAHLIAVGTLSYNDRGYRFYFASQVTPSGDSVQYDQLSGEAHGKIYWDLLQRGEQGEWQVNFGRDSECYGKIL